MAKSGKKLQPFDKQLLSDDVLSELLQFTHNLIKKAFREKGFRLSPGLDSEDITLICYNKILSGKRTLPYPEKDLMYRLKAAIFSEVRNTYKAAVVKWKRENAIQEKVKSDLFFFEINVSEHKANKALVERIFHEIVRRDNKLEMDVFNLMYDGKKPKEIASILSISRKRVSKIKARIKQIGFKCLPRKNNQK